MVLYIYFFGMEAIEADPSEKGDFVSLKGCMEKAPNLTCKPFDKACIGSVSET